MSHGSPFPPQSDPAGLATLSSVPAPGGRVRHPLGLPRGSVRAVLAFMVLGTVWTLLLIPAEKVQDGIPPYLLYLTFLILGSYFGSRAATPHPGDTGAPHPLFLPRGSIRGLIILGFVVACGLGYRHDHEFFQRIKLGHVSAQPLVPILLLGGFFAGVVVNRLAELMLKRPSGMPAWYQDVLAWVSVLAVFGLAFEVIYQLVVVPSSDSASELPPWQGILAGIVAFYFGART